MNEAERLARAWIEGWVAGKPDDIPLAEHFVHSSPLGVMKGRKQYLEWVKPLAAENVATLRILRTLGGNDEAVIWFEMTTPDGVIPVCDWVRTSKGEITAVTSFYDATNLRRR